MGSGCYENRVPSVWQTDSHNRSRTTDTDQSVRFFVHKSIQDFADELIHAYGREGQQAMIFPTPRAARRCDGFIRERGSSADASLVHIIDLGLDESKADARVLTALQPTVSAVLYPTTAHGLAKQYWQHTGDGSSSRRAEFCHRLFKSNLLVPVPNLHQESNGRDAVFPRQSRGPKRYHRAGSIDGLGASPAAARTINTPEEAQESSRFLEERFGRNLDLGLVEKARSAICRRITSTVSGEWDLLDESPPPPPTENTRGVPSLQESDIFLYPCGMNAIFNAHQILLHARGHMRSISFGFPYVDTLKILQKWGPGCRFFGKASTADLDELEQSLRQGDRYLALFCEFPGNPLLTCPDLKRIRKLADEYDFAVVVDETIATFANINVLPDADIVVSSLTKLFSGDGNVMGGSMILNPEGKYYASLKASQQQIYENTYWPEDVIYLERNSRDFASRVDRVNANSEAICNILLSSPFVKEVYYPLINPSRTYYDAYRLPQGGYGGLLSVIFQAESMAQAFYDALQIAKGPSLGTNFTLGSPYVLLAHYQELPWAQSLGVEPHLVRISVGLEEMSRLQATFQRALSAVEAGPRT